MAFIDVYKLGRALPIGWENSAMQQKLLFVLFPYTARDVISTALLFLAGGSILSAVSLMLFLFLGYALFFITLIGALTVYIYPSNIFYMQAIGEYNEEMLRAILRMVTYISMDTSIEYVVVETASHLHGTLKLQFEHITQQLERRQKMTLVDTTKVIPPVFIEAIIGIYLIETILVLSFFVTQINVGNDKFKFFESVRSNMIGFFIYTILLFGEYLFIVEVLFKSILLS